MSGWAIYSDYSGVVRSSDGPFTTEDEALARLVQMLEYERAVLAGKLSRVRARVQYRAQYRKRLEKAHGKAAPQT